MNLFNIVERVLFGEQERLQSETERQKRRRIRRRIDEIERERTQGFIYGDCDELADYFIKAGYKVERFYNMAIRVCWDEGLR